MVPPSQPYQLTTGNFTCPESDRYPKHFLIKVSSLIRRPFVSQFISSDNVYLQMRKGSSVAEDWCVRVRVRGSVVVKCLYGLNIPTLTHHHFRCIFSRKLTNNSATEHLVSVCVMYVCGVLLSPVRGDVFLRVDLCISVCVWVYVFVFVHMIICKHVSTY